MRDVTAHAGHSPLGGDNPLLRRSRRCAWRQGPDAGADSAAGGGSLDAVKKKSDRERCEKCHDTGIWEFEPGESTQCSCRIDELRRRRDRRMRRGIPERFHGVAWERPPVMQFAPATLAGLRRYLRTLDEESNTGEKRGESLWLTGPADHAPDARAEAGPAVLLRVRLRRQLAVPRAAAPDPRARRPRPVGARPAHRHACRPVRRLGQGARPVPPGGGVVSEQRARVTDIRRFVAEVVRELAGPPLLDDPLDTVSWLGDISGGSGLSRARCCSRPGALAIPLFPPPPLERELLEGAGAVKGRASAPSGCEPRSLRSGALYRAGERRIITR